MSISRLMQMAAAGAGGEYQISRSLRFNSADSAYLSRTPASAGDRKTWTWSGWVKRSALGASQQLLSCGSAVSDQIFFGSPDNIQVYLDGAYRVITTAVFRDPSAWYHIVVSVDTTQATPANRTKVYVNGVEYTGTGTAITQNNDTKINDSAAHYIGRYAASAAEYFNGYLTEINFIDGQQLTPTSFGETNATTGVWSPIKFNGPWNVGTGVNGFYLKFSNNSDVTAATLGADYSGNGNNWTPSGFSVTAGAGNDSLVDTPTQYGTDTGAGGEVRGNYATLNPLSLTACTITDGNLRAVGDGGNYDNLPASIAFDAGGSDGFYWEFTSITQDGATLVGICSTNNSELNKANPTSSFANSANGWGYQGNGNKQNSGVNTSYGDAWNSGGGDVIGVAVKNGKIWFSKNGIFQASGDPAAGTNQAFSGISGLVYPVAGINGTHGFIVNFGQRPFAYTAPSGFKALVTTNLPEPTVVQGDDYFNTVLWTGDATNPRSISGVGFQPDLVWIKTRSVANPNLVHDAVRGVTSTDSRSLRTEATDGEVNYYTVNGALNAFESDGFRLAGGSTNNNYNASGGTFVAWNWKADGAGASNGDGTISSTVSVSTTSGFSIVTYTGNGGNAPATIGHGLGVAPKMMILKFSDAVSAWSVYHASLGNTKRLTLNTTDAENTSTGYWNNTSPTSTVFTVGIDFNQFTPYNYVVYCFAEVEGFSKFSSYTGNGSADGTFVYTGFRPAFLMVKRSSSGAATNWIILDTSRDIYNLAGQALLPNLPDAEYTPASSGYPMDILSNGFKQRGTSVSQNASSETYIYMAFAENPFKYSLAR
jgi:hypothetical protein